jgi:hypothetical protein
MDSPLIFSFDSDEFFDEPELGFNDDNVSDCSSSGKDCLQHEIRAPPWETWNYFKL